jgi:hypothetical protein
MKQLRSEVLAATADKLEARSQIPSDKDHPKWLKRVAIKYRQKAVKKEKAVEHKSIQKRRVIRDTREI